MPCASPGLRQTVRNQGPKANCSWEDAALNHSAFATLRKRGYLYCGYQNTENSMLKVKLFQIYVVVMLHGALLYNFVAKAPIYSAGPGSDVGYRTWH